MKKTGLREIMPESFSFSQMPPAVLTQSLRNLLTNLPLPYIVGYTSNQPILLTEVGFVIDDKRPIFIQIAESIEDDIIQGGLPEGAQIPSKNQFASFYQINPATAAKGVNLLVDQGILYKKRGIGMFVATGAQEKLMEKRRKQFFEQYVVTMIREAEKLGITSKQLADMIRKEITPHE